MRFLFRTLTLLLFAFLGFAPFARAQTYYEFLLRVPVVDSSNNNQWAVGQQFWLQADPSFTGTFTDGGNTVVGGNGYLEDSIYVYGDGMGTMWLGTVDCHGDSIVTSIAFDSTMTNLVADTVFICAGSGPACTAYFTFNNTPGNPTISFQGLSTGGGVVIQESWNFDDGNFSATTNPSHTFLNNGNYNVTYEATRSTGCTASATRLVTVTGGNAVCTTSILPSQWGNATNFYVNYTASGTPVNFDWDFGDGNTLGTATNGIFHTYPASGSYNVCVVTTFSDGCMDSTCQTMSIVLGGQGTCTAAFSYLANGQSVAFSDASAGSAPVQSWWWDFGDGSMDSTSGGFVTHVYAGQGPYIASLVIFTTDTCYSTAIDTIFLPPPGGCNAAFTHAPDTTGQYTILAYNTSTGNSLSYLWDFGDGGTSTQPYPIHQYAGAGTYLICLAVTQTSPACTDTFCDSVTVTQKQAAAFTFAVYNPTTAAPAPHGRVEGLHIAPHPVREQLHVTLPAQHDGRAHMRIHNAFGQLVVDADVLIANGRVEWDAADLPNGMYVVQIGKETARFWVLR